MGGVGTRAVALLGFVAVAMILSAAPAEGACPAPSISTSPNTVTVGGIVKVNGDNFFVGCSETGSPSPSPEPADEGIRIQFIQGANVTTLATTDANDDYGFSLNVELPASAKPGKAVIRATGTNGVTNAAITVKARSEKKGKPLPGTGALILPFFVAGLVLLVDGTLMRALGAIVTRLQR